MKLKPMKLSLAISSFVLLALSLPGFAAPVTYPGPTAVDDTGVTVSPTSITVASVTDLDGTAITSPGAVAHVAGPNTSVAYDAAAKGEAWITLTPVLAGHTFTTSPPRIFASADPQTLATVNTTTGGTNTRVTTALPNVAAGASGGLPTGNGSGQVTLAATQAFSNSVASTTTPTWYSAPPTAAQIQSYLDANSALPGLVWTQGTRTITGGTITAYTGNTPQTGDIYARLGAPAGVSLAADVAAVKVDTGGLTTSVAALPSASSIITAILGASFVTIPGTGTTSGSTLVLTGKQVQALTASIAAGNATQTVPAASSTGTVTYYLLGQPKVAGNVVAVSSPTFDANKVLTGRTILIANPFPTIN